jgi:hypothetical protein
MAENILRVWPIGKDAGNVKERRARTDQPTTGGFDASLALTQNSCRRFTRRYGWRIGDAGLSDSPEVLEEGFYWVVLGQNPLEIA